MKRHIPCTTQEETLKVCVWHFISSYQMACSCVDTHMHILITICYTLQILKAMCTHWNCTPQCLQFSSNMFRWKHNEIGRTQLIEWKSTQLTEIQMKWTYIWWKVGDVSSYLTKTKKKRMSTAKKKLNSMLIKEWDNSGLRCRCFWSFGGALLQNLSSTCVSKIKGVFMQVFVITTWMLPKSLFLVVFSCSQFLFFLTAQNICIVYTKLLAHVPMFT